MMTDPRARDWHGMSLAQIQAELRAISGTPYRRNENPVRRRKLWRRLDYLIHQRDEEQAARTTSCCVGVATKKISNGGRPRSFPRFAADNRSDQTNRGIKLSDDGYFGLCPICHKQDGYTNAGRTHVFYCSEHKLSWGGDINIFSTWQWETEEQQRQKWQDHSLDTFQRVKPYYPPDIGVALQPNNPPAGAILPDSSFEAYRAEDPFAAMRDSGNLMLDF
jgi:hypothetical protein